MTPVPAPRPPAPKFGLVVVSSVAYLFTALIAVWAAYDRTAAWGRFALLAGGLVWALGIAWIGRRGGERALALVGLGCALVGAGIGIYFGLTHNWQASGAAKIPGLNLIGLWLQAHRPALPVTDDIHGNVASAALGPLWLLGLGATAHTWRRRWPVLIVGTAAVALLIGGAALILAVSRGAWIGIAAGAGTAAYLALRRAAGGRRRDHGRRGLLGGAFALFVLLIAGILAVAVAPPPALRFLSDASAAGRPQMWRWGLDLIADYPFTGSGLGSTAMVLSSYVLLLHVGFVSHVHDLYLQVAVEQGLPGLIAFLALVALAAASLWQAYRMRGITPLLAGAVAALIALLVHGVVDAGLYASRAAPLMFVPIGFALAARETEAKVEVKAEVEDKVETAASSSTATSTLTLTLISASTLALALLPATRATFQADLGAVAQTRAELSIYRWPKWPLQDALRRQAPGSPPPVDLAPAIAYYEAALALNPGNATANRRLGQIELSQGAYAAAREHLEATYRAAPGQQATRLLLGESDAIAGRTAEAAALWRMVGDPAWRAGAGAGVLALRQRWYDIIGEPEKARWVREAER